MTRPRVNGDGQKELDKVAGQIEDFREELQDFKPLDITFKPQETDLQMPMSNREINQSTVPYIKPIKSIPRPQGGKDGMKVYFDEKYRARHTRDWEYVKCIAENNEVIGESISLWTGKYGCDPCHEWRIPVNKPIYIPRLVAQQLSSCRYHRLKMEDTVTGDTGGGMKFSQGITAVAIENRLDCRPVGNHFSSSGF